MKNILYTRLIRPKSKNALHRNKSIQDKLNSILENKLTVVKGGAAVGKSTLVSNYIGEKNSYMWLSLDENSDDLTCLWTYILHGLKDKIQDLNFYIDMINPLVNRADIFELISSLINELISEEELFIVLDDFHYIDDKFILETIEYFISNSSYNIHFILISRHDIKLYLGNILMKGGVVEINSEDLYLTLEETEEFIKQTTTKVISDDLIKDIYLNTEGWIGAIKLLLTVLRNNKNIKNIPKGNKLFIDYMNNEIMNSLSEDEIDFLVKTSPLSYVNPSIYKEIANKDGFEIIETLIEKNMLIITIDEEKKSFRYHNILRQYLIELFDKYEDEIKNETIDKLTSYLMNDGNYDEAITILITWKRYEEALKVVESNAHNIISTKILNEFPVEYCGGSIDLTFISIFFNYLNLNYERCLAIINFIEGNIHNDILNCIKLFKVIIDTSANFDYYFELPKEIDSNLNILTRTIYYVLASWILGFWGEYTKALEMVDLINNPNKKLNNTYIDLIYKYNKISLLEEMGRLNECEAGYKELNKYINAKKNYKSCFTIFRTVGLPGVYIKKLKDKNAENLLLEAKKVLNNLKQRIVFNSLEKAIDYNLAEVKYIQGHIDECEGLLSNIDTENKYSYFNIYWLALKVRLLSSEDRITKGEYSEFINVYEKLYNKSNYNPAYAGKIGITYGISFFKLDKYEESLNVFNKIGFVCRKNGIGYSLIYALLWKVILLDKLKSDNTRECVNILKEAIFYSRNDDVLFPYYENRKYLKEIIKKFEMQLLEDRDNKDFIKKLNGIMCLNNQNKILSSREMEVLGLLERGLTNKEIAEKLFISLSTVKTHIINIYSKLGVKNRVEAVNEGRKIGCIL